MPPPPTVSHCPLSVPSLRRLLAAEAPAGQDRHRYRGRYFGQREKRKRQVMVVSLAPQQRRGLSGNVCVLARDYVEWKIRR